MPTFIATLRAVYDAADEVEGIFIADQIKVNGSVDLDVDDEDSEDSLEVTQVTSNELEISPEESIAVFKRARNLLIKTRIKQCFELAREFDKVIYILEHRLEGGFDVTNYDYGKFIEVAEAILMRGESPFN